MIPGFREKETFPFWVILETAEMLIGSGAILWELFPAYIAHTQQ